MGHSPALPPSLQAGILAPGPSQTHGAHNLLFTAAAPHQLTTSPVSSESAFSSRSTPPPSLHHRPPPRIPGLTPSMSSPPIVPPRPHELPMDEYSSTNHSPKDNHKQAYSAPPVVPPRPPLDEFDRNQSESMGINAPPPLPPLPPEYLSSQSLSCVPPPQGSPLPEGSEISPLCPSTPSSASTTSSMASFTQNPSFTLPTPVVPEHPATATTFFDELWGSSRATDRPRAPSSPKPPLPPRPPSESPKATTLSYTETSRGSTPLKPISVSFFSLEVNALKPDEPCKGEAEAEEAAEAEELRKALEEMSLRKDFSEKTGLLSRGSREIATEVGSIDVHLEHAHRVQNEILQEMADKKLMKELQADEAIRTKLEEAQSKGDEEESERLARILVEEEKMKEQERLRLIQEEEKRLRELAATEAESEKTLRELAAKEEEEELMKLMMEERKEAERRKKERELQEEQDANFARQLAEEEWQQEAPRRIRVGRLASSGTVVAIGDESNVAGPSRRSKRHPYAAAAPSSVFYNPPSTGRPLPLPQVRPPLPGSSTSPLSDDMRHTSAAIDTEDDSQILIIAPVNPASGPPSAKITSRPRTPSSNFASSSSSTEPSYPPTPSSSQVQSSGGRPPARAASALTPQSRPLIDPAEVIARSPSVGAPPSRAPTPLAESFAAEVQNAESSGDDLMRGVSFGFKPPDIRRSPVRRSELPSCPPFPDVITLSRAPGPPFHIMAQSWRHVLEVLALHETRIEVDVASIAQSKEAQHRLRVVVQFVKLAYTANVWRTIVHLSLDAPLPPNTPHASSYSNGDTTVLPYSYSIAQIQHQHIAAYPGYSEIYVIPLSPTSPFPILPITLSNLALYLHSALRDSRSRKVQNDPLNGMRRLAKLIGNFYPDEVPTTQSNASQAEEKKVSKGVGGLFKRVIGGRGKFKGAEADEELNEETSTMIMPFRIDQYTATSLGKASRSRSNDRAGSSRSA
ncbi:hypothetical protein M422DRAFT_27697 [Sphaerobolus stellatus SS14]|nr:hypothetical protein M422DRAFT_27697 [Sphaerobolus stellatus SS14]